MSIPFVDLGAQYQSIKKEIDQAISGVLQDSAFIGGKRVAAFEEEFAAYLGASHCVGCANGTDAIEIALEALGIGEGDEVLVPAYTWISTANSVCRVGAKPIFVDVDPDFYTIDPNGLKAKITSATKAIIPVHFYGLPADMRSIMTFAQEHKLFVIEDCAQAHGASIEGKKAGTFGDVSTFSFYPGKNLGAYGDGGAMVSNDETIAARCRMIARQGQRKKHDHVMVGRNSRLDGLQAAILSVKLKYLDQWIAGRQQVANTYNELLSDLPLSLPQVPESFAHVYHLYVIQTDRRDDLKAYLGERGIPSLLHYPKPLHQVGVFDPQGPFTVSESMSQNILSLPVYPELTNAQQNEVAEAIRSFFKD